MRFGEFFVRLGYMFCEVWVRFGVQNMYGLVGISLIHAYYLATVGYGGHICALPQP